MKEDSIQMYRFWHKGITQKKHTPIEDYTVKELNEMLMRGEIIDPDLSETCEKVSIIGSAAPFYIFILVAIWIFLIIDVLFLNRG